MLCVLLRKCCIFAADTEFDSEGRYRNMLYNKIYHLDFPIVNFRFIGKNCIAFAYGVYFILVYMIL